MTRLAPALLVLLAAAGGVRAQAPADFKVGSSSQALLAAETVILFKGIYPDARPLPAQSGTTDFAVVDVKKQGDLWAWTVLPLSTGTLVFGARYKTASGDELIAPSGPIKVVEAPLATDADILDIKPPLKAWPPLWPFALAALLLGGAWYAYRRWKEARARRGSAPSPLAPPVPPEQAAERAIEALVASGLWDKDQPAYYLRLTEILREYLEARYGKPVTAMTSAEVARLVKARARDLKVGGAVRELLSRADLVKFARAKPAPEDGPADAELALGVVRATSPEDLARKKEAA